MEDERAAYERVPADQLLHTAGSGAIPGSSIAAATTSSGGLSGTAAGTSSAAGATVGSSCAGSGGGGSAMTPAVRTAWDAATRWLVNLATLAFVADVAARAAAQAAQAAAGAAPGAADWVGLASNLTSFLILSSVFVGDREGEASACYLAGLGGTLLLLAQAFLLRAVPAAFFWPALAVVSGSFAVNAARLAGRLEPPAPVAAAWGLWQEFVGCVGWAMLPQVAYLTLLRPGAAAAAAAAPGAPAATHWGPAAVSLAVGLGLLALVKAGKLPRSCRDVWDVPAWTATLLFMLEPVAALAAAARAPATLLALAPVDFLLPALATGLQVPRALLCRDHMWFTGTSWSTLFACLQAAAAAAAQGRAAAAAGWAAAPAAAAACLLCGMAAAQGSGGRRPLDALRPVGDAYRAQLQPWRDLAACLRPPAARLLKLRLLRLLLRRRRPDQGREAAS